MSTKASVGGGHDEQPSSVRPSPPTVQNAAVRISSPSVELSSLVFYCVLFVAAGFSSRISIRRALKTPLIFLSMTPLTLACNAEPGDLTSAFILDRLQLEDYDGISFLSDSLPWLISGAVCMKHYWRDRTMLKPVCRPRFPKHVRIVAREHYKSTAASAFEGDQLPFPYFRVFYEAHDVDESKDTNFITTLHNHLARNGQSHLLSYAESSTGPSSEAVWTVQCKIAGDVKGVGVASQKALAKQAAARQALEAIRG